MKTKHKAMRLKNGSYNYRGFCFSHDGHRAWCLSDEDGGPFKATRTIKEMCSYIDKNYKKLSEHS